MHKICEELVASHSFIEAAFLLTAESKFTWYGKHRVNPDEIFRLINSIISVADEHNLFNAVPGASVTLSTSYGALYIYAIDMEHTLILCLVDGYTLQSIEEILASTLATQHV